MQQMLLLNPWLAIGFISWLIAQIMKMIVHLIATKKLDFSRLVDSGGMPSSHTALVVGLSTAVGLTEGWRSVAFAIAACFAMVIIYDATNLRRSAGYHAQVLNDVVPQLLKGKLLGEGFAFPKLRELLGHNPLEVFVGGILGILIALWITNYLQLSIAQ